MIPSESIRKEIVNFASKNEDKKITSYLKNELLKKTTTAEQVFNYAERYSFNNTKKYVINPDIINKLGIIIDELEDATQASWGIKFYELAAERGSSWGNHNCAITYLWGDTKLNIVQNSTKALEYIKKAIELAKPDDKNTFKRILSQAYWKNTGNELKAGEALVDYLEAELKKNKPDRKIEDIERAFKFGQSIIEHFHNTIISDKDPLIIQNLLQNLEPFLKRDTCLKQENAYIKLYQKAYYIKAKCHEVLKDFPSAMKAYCEVSDEELPFYADAITSRARLLKNQVEKMLLTPSSPSSQDASQSINQTIDSVSPLLLLDKIPITIEFGKKWEIYSTIKSINIVNQKAIQEEFDKRLKQIEKLIVARKTEIQLVDEALSNTTANSSQSDELTKRKEVLEKELASIESSKKVLSEKFNAHCVDHRQTYRRHAAESTFFEPQRSKKRKRIIELTHSIIDHRFNDKKINDERTNPLPPIALAGTSSRLFISAEKAFQQAVIALTGENEPMLGIPTAREKPWRGDYSSGSMGYGPIERYIVGETEVESEHRTSPKRQRLGDSFLPQHKSYDNNILIFINRLTAKERRNEMALAKLMVQYGRNFTPLSLNDLKEIYETADKNDIDKLNQLCFLMLGKEQTQWHSVTEEKYQLGMSVAQARWLIMLEKGFLSFEDAFKLNPPFGVYSQKNIINIPSDVDKACKSIDSLYTKFLQSTHPDDFISFFKRQIVETPELSYALTREQARQDLKYVHGGDSDSEDEGYSSDLCMPLNN